MLLSAALALWPQAVPAAGPDLSVTFPAPAQLAGALAGTAPLAWFTADGNGASEDMLIRYDDRGGQAAVGLLAGQAGIYGWLGDLVEVDGVVIGNGVIERELFAVDLATGACTFLAGPYDAQYTSVHSLAYDAAGQRLFAVNTNTRQLLLLDPLTGAASKIGNGSLSGYPAVRALAFDQATQLLYAIDQQTDSLISIHPATGATSFLTTVAPFAGARQEELQFVDGKLYMNLGWEVAGSLERAQLTRLDPATGQTTDVGPELQSLSGHCLYIESLPETALWTQVAGPGTAAFSDPTALDAQVSFSAPGVYVLQLAALDSQGLVVGTDTLSVTSAGWEAFCWGDGSGAACPCGNLGGSGEGCANSTGSGGLLVNAGGISVGLDDTVLQASQLPAQKSGLFLLGAFPKNGGLGAPFGDGLRCLQGPPLRRYPVNSTGNGVMTQSSAAGSGFGLIAPGSTWHFQAWHRDAATVCGSQTNLSSAIAITFGP